MARASNLKPNRTAYSAFTHVPYFYEPLAVRYALLDYFPVLYPVRPFPICFRA